MKDQVCLHCAGIRLRPSHPSINTFIAPRSAARAKAAGASLSGNRAVIISPNRISSCSISGSAASNRPQRDPTSVISLTISGAVSTDTIPCTVDFRITAPRGFAMDAAARSPSGLPVASTTQSNSATGSLPSVSSVITPAAAAIRSFSQCLPNEPHGISVHRKHLRDQQAKLAVSQHSHGFARRNRYLIENFARRGQRFGEDRTLNWKPIRQHVQIAIRQHEVFGECARLIDDSQNRAIAGSAAQPLAAPRAVRAGEVDFAHHALADQLGPIRFDHFRNKLMPRRPAKSVVPSLQVPGRYCRFHPLVTEAASTVAAGPE